MGNIKSSKNRYFFVASRDICKLHDGNIDIFFEFRAQTDAENKTSKRPKQDKINEENLQRIQKALCKHKETNILFREKDGETLLGKNLRKYTKKNTADYFIHKDLGGFLHRELDVYIKNEVIDLSDIFKSNTDGLVKHMLECRVLYNICHRVIEFLAQIENFQKRLWEKKKFVLQNRLLQSL